MRKCKIKFTESEQGERIQIECEQGGFSNLEVLGLIDLLRNSLITNIFFEAPSFKPQKP